MHPVTWMFFAVLTTFLVTRMITRYLRRRARQGEAGSGPLRDVTVGGVHVHHQVFGILIMLGAGLGLIAVTPGGVALNVVAALFGVGVSLTFDEFALWLHLDDVYWSQQGRKSIDAIFCVLVVTGMLIGGVDLVTGQVGSADWWSSIGGLAISMICSVISLLKGKVITGVVGVIVQPVGIIGAIRLAKPGSWWARRYYPARPARLARAERRFGREYQQRWNRLRDLVAGAPDR